MTPVDQEFLHGEDVVGDCLRAAIASVLDLAISEVPHFVAEHGSAWFSPVRDWAAIRGLALVWSEGHLCYPFHVIYSGQSPRFHDANHAVVAIDGEVVHDPHPSRAGIKGLARRTYFFVPTKLDMGEYVRSQSMKETCPRCDGFGEIKFLRNKRGEPDFLDGTWDGEWTMCENCYGEGEIDATA